MSIYISESDRKTKKIGRELAKTILKSGQKTIILGLEGDLGGGKTTFLQGFAAGLGIKENVLSPTFVIMRKFKLDCSRGQPFDYFYHIDCYRLKDEKELLDLGFSKIINAAGNVVAIEWADIVEKIIPQSALLIKFIFIGDKKRKIIIAGWEKKKAKKN